MHLNAAYTSLLVNFTTYNNLLFDVNKIIELFEKLFCVI